LHFSALGLRRDGHNWASRRMLVPPVGFRQTASSQLAEAAGGHPVMDCPISTDRVRSAVEERNALPNPIAMDADYSVASEAETGSEARTGRSWFFTKWLAAIGFLVGGSVVFYIGYTSCHPRPPPPGTVACGNCVLGVVLRGWCVMVIGTPLGAIATALAAAIVGGILDCIRHYCRRT
jgi:hypothetical protein